MAVPEATGVQVADEIHPPRPDGGAVLKGRPGSVSIGLDLGVRHAALVSLSENEKQGIVLHAAAVAELPAAAGVGRALRELRQSVPGKSRGVHCNLGPVPVIVQQADFPDMAGDELRAAVRIEAEQLIPNLDEMVLDLQQLDPAPGARDGTVSVLMVAAPRQAVNARADLLFGADVRVLSVVPDGVALANALLALRPPAASAELVLEVGERETTLVAVLPEDVGKAPIVRHMTGGVNFVDAEDDGTGGRREKQHERSRWLQEVERSVQFTSGQGREPVERVLVVGRGAGSQAFLQWMSQNLATPVDRWNPLRELQRAVGAPGEQFVDEVGHHMAVAVGLALTGGG